MPRGTKVTLLVELDDAPHGSLPSANAALHWSALASAGAAPHWPALDEANVCVVKTQCEDEPKDCDDQIPVDAEAHACAEDDVDKSEADS